MKIMDSSRAAIFGYRLRFSPETQVIRQAVIDHVVLLNLRASKAPEGESVGRINRLAVGNTELATVSVPETSASLVRLEADGLVESAPYRQKRRWRLTEKGSQDLGEREALTESMVKRVTDELFGQVQDQSTMRLALLDALALIFDELAQTYLRLITHGNGSKALPVAAEKLELVVEAVVERYTLANPQVFSTALERFLRESTPDFDWLKWTFCKNYYLARAVGIGQESDLLSKGLFRTSRFIIDTNVLIEALDTTSTHHGVVQCIFRGLRRIGAAVAVLEISLQELGQVAANQAENLPMVLAQIPDALLPQTSGVVARAERRHRLDDSEASPLELLKQFESAGERIEEDLGLEVVRDDWFKKSAALPEIEEYAKYLQTHYNANVRGGRRKQMAAALHDALALCWISETQPNSTYFLTFDGSLPSATKAGSDSPSSSVFPAYALLPWLGTVSLEDEELAGPFSAVVSSELIGAASRFSLQEFRLLAELEMECRNLPAEDVEQCLLYLRREARGLDVRRAEDRERLHNIVRRFFADPQRRYLSEVSDLKEKLEDARRRLAESELRRERSEEAARVQLKTLREKSLRSRARNRLLAAAAAYVLLLISSFWLSQTTGAGDNVLQRIGSSWWLFGLSTVLSVVLARFLCRGELWPYAKHALKVLGGE